MARDEVRLSEKDLRNLARAEKAAGGGGGGGGSGPLMIGLGSPPTYNL